MFSGQLHLTDSSDLASELVGGGNVAPGDDAAAAFALLYSETLGLAGVAPGDDPYLGSRASVDSEFGLPASDDYGGPHAASADATGEATWQGLLLDRSHLIELGSGTRERRSSAEDRDLALPGYGSRGRLAPQNKTVAIEPVNEPSSAAPAAERNSGLGLHTSRLADWMDAHALTQSSHHCAMYCRMGMEAAGLSTQDRPRSGDAGDYGPYLLRHGAQVVAADAYTPKVGDTVVFDKTSQHPHGHIEMYDGKQWVSDFRQHSFSPYRDAASTPSFTIYRLS